MRRPTAIQKGFLKGLAVVLLTASLMLWLLTKIPAADPELMQGLASLGTGLLLAYVVEAVWISRRMRVAVDYEDRLGFAISLGASGLVAVAVALLVSAHRAAGHSNLLDRAGLAFVVASLAFLGMMVVCQPLLAHEWDEQKDASDD